MPSARVTTGAGRWLALGVRSAGLDLHADHLDGRVVALHGDGDAGRQAAPAERHDHPPQVGDVGHQLAARASLARR